ncbi:cytochrome P450 [Aspergillus crustosus]
MISSFVGSLLLLLIKLILLRMFMDYTQDSREPPPVDAFIPFVSPIIGMVWAGLAYYTKHRRFPIYTLRLPGLRLYVVNSPSLISEVQHHPRKISFSPILARMATNVIGATQAGAAVLSDDAENGFIRRFHDFNHASLSMGPGLDALRNAFWGRVTCSLLSQRDPSSPPRQIGMYDWVSQEVMMGATEAMYGPRNPFRDAVTRKAWQDYQAGLTQLLLGFMPTIFAKRSLLARDTLVRSLERYYTEQSFNHQEASPYIRDQYHIFSSSGMSDADIARTQAAFTIALMGNTIPAAFWLLYHIVSDDTVLRDCRGELGAAFLETKGRDEGAGPPMLKLRSIEQSCPILLSTFKESMRTHSMGTSVTQVLEEQVIENQYLLKKGAFVLIPAVTQHSNPSIWGKDANHFNHLRFVQDQRIRDLHDKKKASNTPVGYRPWGGGWTLCPGRQFATSMILAFAASAILTFDIHPIRGKWVTPTIQKSNMGVAISQPDEDLDINLRCRDHGSWMAA